MNFQTFSKVVRYSCLCNELQLRLFGDVYPHSEKTLHVLPFVEGKPAAEGLMQAPEGVFADYYLTDEQYEKLFRDLEDAPRILQRLK